MSKEKEMIKFFRNLPIGRYTAYQVNRTMKEEEIIPRSWDPEKDGSWEEWVKTVSEYIIDTETKGISIIKKDQRPEIEKIIKEAGPIFVVEEKL